MLQQKICVFTITSNSATADSHVFNQERLDTVEQKLIAETRILETQLVVAFNQVSAEVTIHDYGKDGK